MKNYIAHGETVTVNAPAAVSSGELVLVGALFGIATADAGNGAPVALATEGVYALPKVTTDVIAVGAKVYFDAGTGLVTTTDTGNTLIGVALSAAGNPSASVNVRLNCCYGI